MTASTPTPLPGPGEDGFDIDAYLARCTYNVNVDWSPWLDCWTATVRIQHPLGVDDHRVFAHADATSHLGGFDAQAGADRAATVLARQALTALHYSAVADQAAAWGHGALAAGLRSATENL